MAGTRLTVLYPHPADIAQFESDYQAHMQLLHEKLGLPADARPYTVTRFIPTPMGPPAFFQMFTFHFSSAEGMGAALNSPEMQDMAADAIRISTGGMPVFMAGVDAD